MYGSIKRLNEKAQANHDRAKIVAKYQAAQAQASQQGPK